jgi:error-prone DNA polymerase
MTFVSLEDETGLTNVIIAPPLYDRRRAVIRTEPFLVVSGMLQRKDGTCNVLARNIHALRIPRDLVAPGSHDWG